MRCHVRSGRIGCDGNTDESLHSWLTIGTYHGFIAIMERTMRLRAGEHFEHWSI